MKFKKLKKREMLYIPLEDIEKIDDAFLSEMERVKTRLKNIGDKDIITKFQQVLLNAYCAEIEVQSRAREVDYDIKFAEIEERKRVLKPFRRCWLWRLLFQPLTNRAQDIIEARAGLDADFIHTAAERGIEADCKKLPTTGEKHLSKRKIKKMLKATIRQADTANSIEAFEEPLASDVPPNVQTVQENAAKSTSQLPGQITLDEVQQQPQTRRPRPPRSCRKP